MARSWANLAASDWGGSLRACSPLLFVLPSGPPCLIPRTPSYWGVALHLQKGKNSGEGQHGSARRKKESVDRLPTLCRNRRICRYCSGGRVKPMSGQDSGRGSDMDHPHPKNHRGRRAADLTRRERQGKVPKIIPPTISSRNGPRRFREAAAAAKTGPACGHGHLNPKISPVSCVWCSRPRHYRRWGSGSSRVARTMTGCEEEEGEGGLCLAQDQGAAQAIVDSLGGGTRHAARRFPRLTTVPPSNERDDQKKKQ